MPLDLGTLILQAMWDALLRILLAGGQAALQQPWLFLVAFLFVVAVIGRGRRPSRRR